MAEPQDVSDALLAELINAAATASNVTHSQKDEKRFGLACDEARKVQHARAKRRKEED